MLQGKKIVLGVTGSIAAYKAAYLVRLLVKQGAEVQVVMTTAAKEFITPVTLSALTGRPVLSEFFASSDGTWHSHVDLGLWADAMIIAPATASTLGKMANGIADNMLVTCYLSCKAPVFVAPAMDLDMYAHPSTQRNIEILRSYNNYIIEPGTGFLASHLEGKGRMEDPEKIVEIIGASFENKTTLLSKKKVLITAGPTYEKIDPVRFIGNYSSGKMGFALAEAFVSQGAEVTLIAGPVSLKTPKGVHRIDVESASQMYDVSVAHFESVDIAVMAAAVADYRPEQYADQKIKRGSDDMLLTLVPNQDIAAALGALKHPNQLLVGFALETNDEHTNALRKIEKKNLDCIVLNSLQVAGAGFQHDTNQISIINRVGDTTHFKLKTKQEVADDIVTYVSNMLQDSL